MANVGQTKIKLSKKKAGVFKRSAAKAAAAMDVDVAQRALDVEMDTSTGDQKPKVKLTKKRLLRQQKKAELRKCFEAKRQKTRALVPDAMEGAAAPEEAEKPKQKINEKRVRQHELPIRLSDNKKQLNIQVKELISEGNVVSGRRISKKKARKILNAKKRTERERERTQNAMDA
ncbi:hypothetical protein M3Y99_00038500 [Aphelenchoides fujianensis]|nr:hypothetical protein M3Y99_00038500 [Aphelenchoides fujianensis]